jgi:cardiolipin synthase
VDDVAEPFDAAAEPPASVAPRGGSECIVLRDAAETGASDLRVLMLSLIQLAQRRIRIASAYFNPDDQLLDAFCRAAERGVEVQLMFPGEHADKRFVRLGGEADYGVLLERGVDLRTYERTMLHAKVVTVDGALASIGSANLNRRSMEHDDECNLLVFDPEIVAELDRHFDDDLRHTVDLDPQRWAERGLFQRLGESITGVADRWL